MKKLLFIAITLSTIFFLTTAFEKISDNYFQIGSEKWKIESAEIANESYSTKSKFELNFINGAKKLSDAKTFINISLTTTNTNKVAEGMYEISERPLSIREPYHFNGSVFVNEKEVKIVKGIFSIEKINNSFSVNMIFKLENGDILNGSYDGESFFIDRSKNYK